MRREPRFFNFIIIATILFMSSGCSKPYGKIGTLGVWGNLTWIHPQANTFRDFKSAPADASYRGFRIKRGPQTYQVKIPKQIRVHSVNGQSLPYLNKRQSFTNSNYNKELWFPVGSHSLEISVKVEDRNLLGYPLTFDINGDADDVFFISFCINENDWGVKVTKQCTTDEPPQYEYHGAQIGEDSLYCGDLESSFNTKNPLEQMFREIQADDYSTKCKNSEK